MKVCVGCEFREFRPSGNPIADLAREFLFFPFEIIIGGSGSDRFLRLRGVFGGGCLRSAETAYGGNVVRIPSCWAKRDVPQPARSEIPTGLIPHAYRGKMHSAIQYVRIQVTRCRINRTAIGPRSRPKVQLRTGQYLAEVGILLMAIYLPQSDYPSTSCFVRVEFFRRQFWVSIGILRGRIRIFFRIFNRYWVFFGVLQGRESYYLSSWEVVRAVVVPSPFQESGAPSYPNANSRNPSSMLRFSVFCDAWFEGGNFKNVLNPLCDR